MAIRARGLAPLLQVFDMLTPNACCRDVLCVEVVGTSALAACARLQRSRRNE